MGITNYPTIALNKLHIILISQHLWNPTSKWKTTSILWALIMYHILFINQDTDYAWYQGADLKTINTREYTHEHTSTQNKTTNGRTTTKPIFIEQTQNSNWGAPNLEFYLL